MKKHLLLIFLILSALVLVLILFLTHSSGETEGIFVSTLVFRYAQLGLNLVVVFAVPLLFVNYLIFSQKRIKRLWQMLVWLPVYAWIVCLWFIDIFSSGSIKNFSIVNPISSFLEIVYSSIYGVVILLIFYFLLFYFREKTSMENYITKQQLTTSFIIIFITVIALNILALAFSGLASQGAGA